MRVSDAKLEQIGVASVGSPLEGNLALDLIEARARCVELQAKLEQARGFAADVLRDFPESAPDECDIQELAVKHGLLIPTEAKESCGENCWCEEYHGDFPVTCYHRAALLASNPEGM